MTPDLKLPVSDLLPPLLERMRDDVAGLAATRAAAAAGDCDKGAALLLEYFRARPQEFTLPGPSRSQRAASRGKIAGERSLQVAAAALEGRLLILPAAEPVAVGRTTDAAGNSVVDWLANPSPTGDYEWFSHLHRHNSWAHMGLALWHTGDERYAELYAAQLASWIEQCSGLVEKGGPFWGKIEIGVRARAWCRHFCLFLDSPAYTPALLVRHLHAFATHAELLTGGFERLNHGLFEAEGLAWIGLLFPEFKAAGAWRARGFGHFAAEIAAQVTDDGMHVERTAWYHRDCTFLFSRMLDLARRNGLEKLLPETYAPTIEKMYEVMGNLAHPDLRGAMMGDSPEHFVLEDMKRGAAEFPENEVIRFFATEGAGGKPPNRRRQLHNAGYYSMRNSWNPSAIHMLIKNARHAGGHSHPDNLSFELFAYHRYFMPDSGVFIYNEDAEGNFEWFRRTTSHQTLTLNGMNTQWAPQCLVWQAIPEMDVFCGVNRSYDELRHRRTIFFVRRKYFVIVDDAMGPAVGELRLHFQILRSRIEYQFPELEFRTDFPKGANLLVRASQQRGLTMEKVRGEVSAHYGVKEERPAFDFILPKNAPAPHRRFVTVVVPWHGERPVLQVTRVGEVTPGSDVVLPLENPIRLGLRLNDERLALSCDLETREMSLTPE